MMEEYMNKKAEELPGDFLQRLYMSAMGDKPVKNVDYGGVEPIEASQIGLGGEGMPKMVPIAKRLAERYSKTPQRFEGDYYITQPEYDTAYNYNTRLHQGKALSTILKTLGVSALGGGAYGLIRHLPKWMEARKAIKETEEDEKKASVKSAGKVDDFLNALPWGGRTMGIPTGPVTYGGIPHSPWAVKMLGLRGAAAPLTVGAIGAGAIGADKLVDWMVDKARDKALKKRKKELQEEFKGLLEGNEKVSSVLLDKMADAFEKTSEGPAKTGPVHIEPAVALAAMLAGVTGGGIFHLAKTFSESSSPYGAQAKALKRILRRRANTKYPYLRLEESENGELAVPARTSLVGSEHVMPINIDKRRAVEDDEDEGYDLSKLSSAKDAGIKDWLLSDKNPLKPLGDLVGNTFADAREGVQGVRDTYQQGKELIPKAKQTMDQVSGAVEQLNTPEMQAIVGKLKGLKPEQLEGALGMLGKLNNPKLQALLNDENIDAVSGMLDTAKKFKSFGSDFMRGAKDTIGDIGRFLTGTPEVLQGLLGGLSQPLTTTGTQSSTVPQSGVTGTQAIANTMKPVRTEAPIVQPVINAPASPAPSGVGITGRGITPGGADGSAAAVTAGQKVKTAPIGQTTNPKA